MTYREVKAVDLRVVGHKSTALAAQNFMVSMAALGYDTCPMEGFDSVRLKGRRRWFVMFGFKPSPEKRIMCPSYFEFHFIGLDRDLVMTESEKCKYLIKDQGSRIKD